MWLIASLTFSPSTVTQGTQRSASIYNSATEEWVESHYEDLNGNLAWDPGEPFWDNFNDADYDGLEDGREAYWGTSIYNPDTDSDGFSDGNEVDLLGGPFSGYDPADWDTDGDGYSDSDEYALCTAVDYNLWGPGQNYHDWDGDGLDNPMDAWPLDPNNGYDPSLADSDSDGTADYFDSHPSDGALWNDWNYNGVNDDQEGGGNPSSTDSDSDGIYDLYDSHPTESNLWNDWNYNGINDDQEYNPYMTDSDGDGLMDAQDSHPNDSALWCDWNSNGINDDHEGGGQYDPTVNDADGDGVADAYDTNPGDPSLWNDHNLNGINDEAEPPDPYTTDSDYDGIMDAYDSHPWDSALRCDWNYNGINDDQEILDTDADGDGYYDGYDSNMLDPTLWDDWDGDGMNVSDEYLFGSNPYNGDTDGDGLLDGEERILGTLPTSQDTDSDGLTDYEEVHLNPPSDPNDAYSIGKRLNMGVSYTDWQLSDITDTDGDLIPDAIERLYGLDPTVAADAAGDLNADGTTNLQAYLQGIAIRSYVTSLDWDGDGITNVEEIYWSSIYPGIFSPWEFEDATEDFDHDGVLNFEELTLNLNPGDPDSWTQEVETSSQWLSPNVLAPLSPDMVRARSTNTTWGWPLLPEDTDGDGMSDVWEYRYRAIGGVAGLNLRSPVDAGTDLDDDHLSNLTEFRYHTHPRLRETVTGTADTSAFHNQNAPASTPPTGLLSRYRSQIATDLGIGTSVNKAFMHSLPITAPGGPNNPNPSPSVDIEVSMTEAHPVRDNGHRYATGGTQLTSTFLPNLCGKDACLAGCTDGNVKTQCDVCGGDKKIDCTASQCNGGKVPCPTCANQSSCSICGGDGLVEGSTRITCSSCPSDGSYCTICQGNGGWDETATSACSACTAPCMNCNNTFVIDCGECGGDTEVDCMKCDAIGQIDIPCPNCDGDGIMSSCRCKLPGCSCGAPCTLHQERESAMVKLVIPQGTPHPESIEYGVYVDGSRVGVLTQNHTVTFVGHPPPGQSVLITSLPVAQPGSSPNILGSISASDQTGPRYRKVGLNGIPMSDSKPQVQDESGEVPEETYVDAYNRQLRHSTSDVYVQADSSLLPLTVRRDLTPEAWTESSGLRPNERMDKPFGPGWSSNICAYVKFERSSPYSNVSRKATVLDEQGTPQTFLEYGPTWVSSREEKVDAKTSFNKFSLTHTQGVVGPTGAELEKKFGSTCTYENTPIVYRYWSDRLHNSGQMETIEYARLKTVKDRWGNRLEYTYPDEMPGNHAPSLIPCKIADPQRPGHFVTIEQADGHVTAVRGPGGDTTHYSYSAYTTSSFRDGLRGKLLTQVSKGSSQVHYDYALVDEMDPTPIDWNVTAYEHIELSAIVDERGASYAFQRVLDHSNSFTQMSGSNPVARVQTGLPMLLTSITSPYGTVLVGGNRDDILTCQPALRGVSGLRIISIPSNIFSLQDVEVNDVETTFCLQGNNTTSNPYTYTFSQPYKFLPPQGVDDDMVSTSLSISFQQMQLQSPLGTEIYHFNVDASMALDSVTDLSGNTTKFYYDPARAQAEAGLTGLPDNVASNGAIYDDPIAEINALGGVKRFTYHSGTRILESVKDPRGVTTTYGIDSRGRRTSETVSGPISGGGTKFFEYGNTTFPGMVTREVVQSISPGMPDSVTKYTLGSPADYQGTNSAWWREITGSTGFGEGSSFMPLTTSTTISDFNGNKISIIDGRGIVTNFDYDANNRLEAVHYSGGGSKSLAYDDHGNLTKEINENGVATIHQYDGLNRRVKTTLDLNNSGSADPTYSSVTYDSNGAPVYDGDLVSSTTYNVRNQVLTQTDPRGKVIENTYDNGGRLLSTNDGGVVTTFDYGPLAAGIPANSGGSVFDTSGFKPTKITAQRDAQTSIVTTIRYDALYRPTHKTVDAGTGPGHVNALTQTHYDAVGNPVRVIDPLNRETIQTFDALGQVTVTRFHDPARGLVTLFDPTVQTLYTSHGKPWKVINEAGHESRTYYDAAGRPIQVDAPVSLGVWAISYTSYDAAGNATSTQDPLGRITLTEYDLRNRPTRVILPPVWDASTPQGGFVRSTVQTAYDNAGQVTSVTDPMDAVTHKFYDRAGRNWKVLAPAKEAGGTPAKTLTEFDPNGNALKLTNALGKTVVNTYDAHNRLTSTVERPNATVAPTETITTTFEYDFAGNRTRVTDGLNQESTFTYDGLNRLLTQKYPHGTSATVKDTWTFTYNALQKTDQVDPNGVNTHYTYDFRDRLKTVAPGTDPLRTYGYDKAGRLLTVSEAEFTEANVVYTYDYAGRVLNETSRGFVHTYTYDLAGNRTSAEYGTGRTVTTSYDALNRPETIAESGRLTQYGYDLAGRAVIQVLGNGQVTQNAYDRLGRLVDRTLFASLEGHRTDTGVLAEFGWGHDDLGNVTAQHETWPGSSARPAGVRITAMTYDDVNRLKTESVTEGSSVTTTTYTYDAGNNRSSKAVTGGTDPGYWTYVYNSANQLTSWKKWTAENGSELRSTTLTYDDNGNRTSQLASGTFDTGAVNPPNVANGTTSYSWDNSNRLTNVAMAMADGNSYSYSYSYSYRYDYRMRRISTAAGGAAPAKHTSILFSGGLSVAEYESPTAPSAGIPTGAPAVQYQRGPDMGGGVGGMLYSLRTTSGGGLKTRYTISNGRGDVVAQSDQAATLTWTASYEAHGRRTVETNPGENEDKQRANSKDEDPTGLLNEGFRYRDLETGVFLSRDPAGFVDGPNVYAYVKQNPWSKFDPNGLAGERVDDDGFKWSSNDHHVVPREVARDAGWNKEAKEVFDRSKISTTGAGHGNSAHPKYNQEVAAEMGEFLKAEGVTDIGSAKNQRELAEHLVERLSKTQNAYIKGFNGVVGEGPEAVKAWYDSIGKGIVLKSTGRIASEGGPIVNGIAHLGAKGGRLIARGVPVVGGVVVGALSLMGGGSNAEAAAEIVANSTFVGGIALDFSHLRDISGLQKTVTQFHDDPNFYLPKNTGTSAGDAISNNLNALKRLLQEDP